MEAARFIIGENYEMMFIGDSELKPLYTCIARTEKTAKFKRLRIDETIIRRIRVYDNTEYVRDGSYSMAPSISAKHKAVNI
jgi:hypothetical protein